MERNPERSGSVRSEMRDDEHDEDRGADMPERPERQDMRDAELPHSPQEERMELFSRDKSDGMSKRWEEIQHMFVDDPRQAVQGADRLVDETMRELSSQFQSARQKLEHQWDRGDEASTEDLRQAMQRYRSFFRRLLAV